MIFTPTCGTTIGDAIDGAIAKAKSTKQRLHLVFNGRKILVGPQSDGNAVYRKWLSQRYAAEEGPK